MTTSDDNFKPGRDVGETQFLSSVGDGVAAVNAFNIGTAPTIAQLINRSGTGEVFWEPMIEFRMAEYPDGRMVLQQQFVCRLYDGGGIGMSYLSEPKYEWRDLPKVKVDVNGNVLPGQNGAQVFKGV